MVDVAVPGGASTPVLRAHLAVPAGDGPWPGVVVLHELLGLTDDIRRQSDRLADAGYLAVAPDLFSAGGALRCLKATFGALTRGEGPAVDDILAVRDWHTGRPDCAGPVGVVGFCMGGGFALLLAARGFDAAAPSYGPLPREARTVLAGSCPVVASYGGRDPMMRGVAGRLEGVLTALGVEHDVKEYPGVGHSFLNHHGAFAPLERVAGLGFDQAAADDAWARILAFFDHHLRT
ncbi:MAG: dienelactone hydrolase family protein [Actinomycetota bacterium]